MNNRSSSKLQNRSQSRGKKVNTLGLDHLMQSIRQLQQKVEHMPICEHQKSMRCSTPTNIRSIYEKGIKRPASVKTRRKQMCQTGADSVLSQNSQTLKVKEPKLTETSVQVCQQQNNSSDSSLLINYMSLQVENLKLDRDNMRLQKQMAQQSLLMEKRQNQLLRNKLKRLKTYQGNEAATVLKQQNLKVVPHVNSFDYQPLHIHITSLSDLSAGQTTAKGNERSVPQQEMDSLLLSDDNEVFQNSQRHCKKVTGQEKDTIVWDLLGHSKASKRNSQTSRLALNDISNRIAIMGKNIK